MGQGYNKQEEIWNKRRIIYDTQSRYIVGDD